MDSLEIRYVSIFSVYKCFEHPLNVENITLKSLIIIIQLNDNVECA
jgi:hypothetical protein